MEFLSVIGLIAVILVAVALFIGGVTFIADVHQTNKRVEEMYYKNLAIGKKK